MKKLIIYLIIKKCIFYKRVKVNKIDAFIHLVAGSDFTPKTISNAKISSKEETLRIDLVKTKK